jgi:hypothetical protein
VCEGLELADGSTLAEYFVQALSTVRVVLAPAPGGSSSLPALRSSGGEEGEGEGSIILDDEVARAIVVQGIPEADAAATDAALHDAFARYGNITRLIFQGDGSGHTQHAVLVYEREPSAAAALTAVGTLILGSPVNVLLANNLAGQRKPSHASDVVGALLASGVLFGVQGVAHVRRFDEANGLSSRVKVAMSAVDKRFAVEQTLRTGYEAARNQAAEIDSRFRLRETARGAAGAAIGTASALGSSLAGMALSNSAVASAVSTASGFFSGVANALQPTVQGLERSVKQAVGPVVAQVKSDLSNIDAKLHHTTMAGGEGEAALPPQRPADTLTMSMDDILGPAAAAAPASPSLADDGGSLAHGGSVAI